MAAVVLASPLVMSQASTMKLEHCTNESRLPRHHLMPPHARAMLRDSSNVSRYSRLAVMISGVISNQAATQQFALMRLMARNLFRPLLSVAATVDTLACTDIEFNVGALDSITRTGSRVESVVWCLDAQTSGHVPPQLMLSLIHI